MRAYGVLLSAAILLCPVVATAGTLAPAGGPTTGVLDADSNVGTTLATKLAGEDVLNDVQRAESQFEYETVAASQTDQVMGSTGSAGDLLHALHCVWTAASAAGVSIKDGTGSSIPVFETKSSATSQTVTLDMVSADAGWKITTSTNTTCIGIGRFN